MTERWTSETSAPSRNDEELERAPERTSAVDRNAPEPSPKTRHVPLCLERRGLGCQRFERQLDHAVASGIWETVVSVGKPSHLTVKDIALTLGVSRATLYSWKTVISGMPRQVKPLGRRQRRASVAERNAVLATIHARGPGVSIAFLRKNHPQVARRQLKNLVRRYRRAYRKWQAKHRYRLIWHEPQTVWAMDHAFPPQPIDGKYEAVLIVRDLGSGAQLLWTPVESTTSGEVVTWLEALVAEHGAPLVLKEDNGSAFTSWRMVAFLERHGIEPLYSPIRTPSYNGSCEASVGSMKTRTHEAAFEAGRPGRWCADDLAVALARHRLENPIVPARPGTRSPARRDAFRQRVRRLRRALEIAYGHDRAASVDPLEVRLVQRQSVHRALVEHGILTTWRRCSSLLN